MPRGIRRKHRVKQVDDETWNIHLNDHVLVEWQKDGTSYDIHILLTLGPYIIENFVKGSSTMPLHMWMLHDVGFIGQTQFGKEYIMWDFDNVDLRVEQVPEICTYLRMARERGAF